MTRRRRIILGVLFVFFTTVCGFMAGLYIGGSFFLPPGSGLAGPAIVLGYGVVGAGLAGVVGVALAYFLPPNWFLGALLPIAVAGVVSSIILVKGYLRSQAQLQAHLEQGYENLNRFSVTLVHLTDQNAPFKRMDADWEMRRYTAITNDAKPKTCTAKISGREAVALLGALREVEGVLLQDAFPCAGTLRRYTRRGCRDRSPPAPEHLWSA
jgi:hypothetical protein